MMSACGRRAARRLVPCGAALALAVALGPTLPAMAQTAAPAAPAAVPAAAPAEPGKPAVVESAPLAPPPGAQAAPSQPAPPAADTKQEPAAAAPAPVPAAPPAQPAQPVAPAAAPPAAGASDQAAPPAAPPAAPAAPAQSTQGTATPAVTGTAGSVPTLAPAPSDAANVDDVTLVEKPAAVLAGQSTWEEGFKTISETFRKIDAELGKAGLKAAGKPLTVFVETDDTGFRFDAMVPVERVPDGKTELTPEIRFGKTPAGKALRFVHKAPYDEIDSTYEAITAYLDAKGITVKDAFVEEYVNEVKDPTDAALEIYVYVQPK